MIRTLLMTTAALAIATPALAAPSKSAAPTAAMAATNPFAKPSSLPYQTPDYARIKDSDYLPAFIAGMAQNKREIDAITNQKAAPTFDNTLGALENSGLMLERVALTFSAVAGANTNDTLDAVDTKTAPLLAQHRDYLFLNKKLFARVKSLHDRQASLRLNPEQARLLEVYYQQFVHAGAELAPAKQVELKAYNKRLSSLESSFGQKLTAATKDGALRVTDKAALAGLSDAQIADAATAAKSRKVDGYVLPMQNTTQQPTMGSLTNRATREALFNASWTRSEKGDANDTRPVVAEIASLRAKKAALMGYDNWASYALYDQMAKNADTAKGFLARLAPAVAAKEKAEAADIQAMIDKQGGGFKAKPWDWDYYSEAVRKERYALDGDSLKPYFEINTVLEKGVFFAANQLYGVTFKERKDLPMWSPDMRAFEVHEENGKLIGLMMFDYWKRDNKQGGAWMSNLVNQSYLRKTIPVIYNVGNFAKPAAGQPALITFDDVTTMFHEFGHALHGLFAAQTYPTISGTATARDFVEFPSQFNENWALEPRVLANYAVNYQTKAPIPQALVDKIKQSRTFNQGNALGQAVTSARMDLDWHSLPADAPLQDVDKFEAAALASGGFDYQDVPPRYRSSYFRHIWSGGYAAGYYAYAWTEMLDHDAFAWFQANGGMTRANGQRFRDMVLSRGNTIDYAEMFKAFTGRDPDIQPMIDYRGLGGTATGGNH